VESNIIGQYTCILANNAQEVTPYRYEFKYDTHRIRKYFLSLPRFVAALTATTTAKEISVQVKLMDPLV
jgi:hypothetical protein